MVEHRIGDFPSTVICVCISCVYFHSFLTDIYNIPLGK